MVDKNVDILYADESWVYFRVKSDSRDEYQYVSFDRFDGWVCTCEHYQFRKAYCKHMQRAKDFLDTLNSTVQSNSVAFQGNLL